MGKRESVIPDEKVEELFCYEANSEAGFTKCIGVTKSGKYYDIETQEYHVGSGYSCSNIYYPIESNEVSYYQKIAEGRKRIEELKSLEEERTRLENQQRLITNGSDRDFYKKKKTDTIWWAKEDNGEHMFSFDKENPYWKVYFQKKNKG